MSNPFDDLESGDSDTGGDEPDSKRTDTTIDPESSRESDEQPSTTVEPSEAGPAFEYSEVRQKPLYARDETWTKFEKSLRTKITPQLAEEDVVDEETREIHDAVLRLANENPERIAELVLEARKQ